MSEATTRRPGYITCGPGVDRPRRLRVVSFEQDPRTRANGATKDGGAAVSLVISEDELRMTGMTESALRLEIAVLLFRKEKLTLEQASRLASVTRIEYQRVLAGREIPVHYDVEEFQRDVCALKEAGSL